MNRKISGYGLAKNTVIHTVNTNELPIQVHDFRRALFKAYCLFIVFAMVLAFVLPDDIRGKNPGFSRWIDWIQRVIPYINWIEKNSKIPTLSTVWFATVWPLLLSYLLYVVAIFPYRSAYIMVCKTRLSRWKHLQVLLILVLGTWMTYSVFYERNFATTKSAAQGHARLIELMAIDSRIGLIFLAPLLISFCLVIWSSTLVAFLAYVSAFFHGNKSAHFNGESK